MKRPIDHRLHPAPHHHHHRYRPRLAQISAVALVGVSIFGCSDRTTEPTDDLEAILKDGDLTQLNQRALTAAAVIPTVVSGNGGGTVAGGPVGVGGAGPGGGTGAGPSVDGGSGMVPDGGIAVDGGGVGGIGGAFPPDGGSGSGGSGMGGGAGGQFPEERQAFWQFDDCFSGRTELSDSTFNGHTAFRSVSAGCVAGSQGTGQFQDQAIGIDGDDDYVYVPDQPNFTFANGVTAAAWVKPARLGDVRTILRKREGGTSTFVLASNGRDYQFVIRLENGRAAAVSARAPLNVWTHVAGTYDGRELRLYLNGVLAAKSRISGRLSEGAGPLLMGNDAFGRRIDGAIDGVFFDTNAATPQEIGKLNCVLRPMTLVAVPGAGPMVPAGTPVSYDVQVTNHDSPTCEPRSSLFLDAIPDVPAISANPTFAFLEPLAPGATSHTAISVTSTATAEAEDYSVSLSVFSNEPPFDQVSGTLKYSVAGTACSVRSRRELEIRDVSVVDDPVRTAPGGAWTFGRLMENMAPTPAAAPAMVEAMLSTWLTNQSVGGFTVFARPSMQGLVLSPFPRTPDGKLDLSKAPFRLLAIVNRIDLQDVSQKSAGEGRFVFGVLDQFGNPLQLTMIVEYNIPAATAQDVTTLANAWHALSALPFPSEQYNAALQSVTERFTARNAAPGRVNGSALGQFRTNDFFALGEWEFREFHLSPVTGQLQPVPVALTPDRSLNNTTRLADYLNANEAAILAEKHTVPETFQGQPFQGGSMITNFFTWNAPCVKPEVREKFAVNTCNGCHTSPLETNTFVFQVNPRALGEESTLSPFLLGTQVTDFQAGVIRNFNELGRRGRLLHDMVCPDEPLPPPPPATTPIGGGSGGFGGRGGIGGASGGPIGMTGSGGVSGATGGATGMAGKEGGTGGRTGGGGISGTGGVSSCGFGGATGSGGAGGAPGMGGIAGPPGMGGKGI